MSHQPISSEITFVPEHSESTKRIWRTFWLLSIITGIELGIGLAIYNIHKGPDPSAMLVLFFKGMVSILTIAKAYYIVSVFMHLGDEIRNMIMTIVVPLLLFIWFIIAFIVDGNSYKNLRNKYDSHFKETTMPKEHHEKPATEQPKPGKQ